MYFKNIIFNNFKMNEILPKSMKNLIKLCVKRPYEINSETISSLPKIFSPDDIIHNLLVAIRKLFC